MNSTTDQLSAVLAAAEKVLGARQDQMLTIQEWTALARAVAVCTGRKTANLLTERDLEQGGAVRRAVGRGGGRPAGGGAWRVAEEVHSAW